MNDSTLYSCVVGARMCRLHRQTVNDELPKHTNDQPSFMENSFSNESIALDDEPYQPDVYIIDETSESNFEIAQDLSSIFCVTPVKFQVTKSIGDISDSNIRYLKRKREEFVSSARSFIDEAITPPRSRRDTGSVR